MNRLRISLIGGLLAGGGTWIVAILVVTLNGIVPVWPFGIIAAVSAAFLFLVDLATEKGEKQ